MVFRGSNEQGYRRSRGIGGSCGPSVIKPFDFYGRLVGINMPYMDPVGFYPSTEC